jgi:hypothetical protein
MAYSLEITRTPSIDSNFLFERHTTTFVDYLRISLQSCAFSGNPQDACYFILNECIIFLPTS